MRILPVVLLKQLSLLLNRMGIVFLLIIVLMKNNILKITMIKSRRMIQRDYLELQMLKIKIQIFNLKSIFLL